MASVHRLKRLSAPSPRAPLVLLPLVVGSRPSPAGQGISSSSPMAPTRMLLSTAAFEGGPLSPSRKLSCPCCRAASEGGPLSPPWTHSSPWGRMLSPLRCRLGVRTDKGPSKETDEVTDKCPPPFQSIQLRLQPTPVLGRPELIWYNLPAPPGIGRAESIRLDGVDSAMEKANLMSESSDEDVKEAEAESSHQESIMQVAYNLFVNHMKTYTQYFEFDDYLWEEADFVKHDSDAESILSSGILPKDKVSLMHPDLIIECLENVIHFKKQVFTAQQLFLCGLHLSKCDFIEYDSNDEVIVDLTMARFPRLDYYAVRSAVARYMGRLAMSMDGGSNAQEEFRSRYFKTCLKDYQHFIDSIERREYISGPEGDHFVFRDIVHKHHSKGLEVDVEKEFCEFFNVPPGFCTLLHGRPNW